MKTYKLEIEITVSENWIADGFNPENKGWKKSIEESINNLMPYAFEHEFQAKVKNVVQPKFTIKELEDLGMI